MALKLLHGETTAMLTRHTMIWALLLVGLLLAIVTTALLWHFSRLTSP